MPIPPSVQGYTGLTQETCLVLEPTANPVGEQLLLGQTAGASTMSLTTQPNTLSPTTGMYLHFYVIGNPTAGSIGIVGTDGAGGAQTSITYHVPIAPQNGQGYSEFTTKEVWKTVTASNITLTTLTPCKIIVYGTYAPKFLLPATSDAEEKIAHHAPVDKRGILFKNLRVSQLTKGVSVDKLDADLYPGSLWIPYNLIGNTPVVTTQPASPVSLLAATTIASTMTLTTSLSTVPPGMFLIFTPAGNSATGTITLAGVDQNGYTVSETITVAANNNVVYSTKRYASIANSGADKFGTTGMTGGSTLAVTAVYAWTYTWTYDGTTNVQPYSSALRLYNGVFGVLLPGVVLSEGIFDWQKEKEILFTSKGEAQDFLVVGDNTSTTGGTKPFATTPAQPTDNPVVSWPATFYIDAATGTALATQDGTLETFKAQIMSGRKWKYTGDGMQRPAFVTWDSEPDFALDATIVLQNYVNYVNYFKPNLPMIFGATFQGALLGSYSSTVYYENWSFTFPTKIDTFKPDFSKSPVEGVLKLMACYDFSNLALGYKLAVTAAQPPTYTA